MKPNPFEVRPKIVAPMVIAPQTTMFHHAANRLLVTVLGGFELVVGIELMVLGGVLISDGAFRVVNGRGLYKFPSPVNLDPPFSL